MTQQELSQLSKLENHIYSLSQLDDAQLYKEVGMQLEEHKKKPPSSVLNRSYYATATGIYENFDGTYFTDEERQRLQHYLAWAHLVKAS